jgi:hypothetical protein
MAHRPPAPAPIRTPSTDAVPEVAMSRRSSQVFVVMTALSLLAAVPVLANQRHFTNSYETAVLAPGVVEIEPWSTARLGKDQFYTGIDNRLEFEVGLTEHLQTSLYVNWGTEGQRGGDGVITSSTNHKGISSEWKYKLSDSVADAIGSALYLEIGLGPAEAEVESKLLIDKRFGNVNFVFNAIYEYERNFTEGINEHKLAATAGLSYFVNDHASIGIEAMNFNVMEPKSPGLSNELMHGAVFAGPVVSYGAHNWWVAASVTPQLYGYGNALESGRGLDLQDFERVQGRILVGVHL